MWGTALPPGQQTPTHPHPAIAGGSDSLRKGPGPRGGLPETRRSRRVPQQLPAAGPLAEWSLRRPDDTVREAVAKPAPRPPGTQPRARGQGAERSRPGAVLGPWGDRSTCPPVPRFVVRSGSWASPWGPGPVPALPPAVAPEPLARAAECHSLPPLTPHRHPRRPRAGLAPCVHQDHSPPTLCPLPGAGRGAGSQGADLEDTTVGWSPASTQAPFQKVVPGRPPQTETVPPPGLPSVGTFLQAASSTEAPRHGPSQVLTGLCPSSGDSAMPGSRGTPAHSGTPRSLSPPWVRAGWTLHSQVCPPTCAPHHPRACLQEGLEPPSWRV